MVGQLTTLLQDQDPGVRRTAAEALGKIGRAGGNPALLESLEDPAPLVRAASARALGRTGTGDVRVALRIAERLRDSSEAVKQEAALALGEFAGSPALTERLVGLFQTSDPSTRRAVILALASVEALDAFDTLVAALRDEDAAVRQGAVSALGELADRRALPFLLDRMRTDPAAGVRSEAAFRLGKVGDRRVLEDVRGVAERDQDAGVRRWAQWANRQVTSSPDSD